MKRSVIIVVAAVLYVGSWAAFGERALLERDVRVIWEDDDVDEYGRRYGEALPHVLCTDLTSRDSVTWHGRAARVIPWDTCFSEGSRSVLWDLDRNRDRSEELGLIVGNAVQRHPNPLLTRNEIGVWYYGTDHAPTREEWVTWAFFGWVPLYRTSGGL